MHTEKGKNSHTLNLYHIYVHSQTHILKRRGKYVEAFPILIDCDMRCLLLETGKTVQSDLKI